MPNGRGKEFESMSDAELLEAMNPEMRSMLNACYYRTLGQVSAPWNIQQVMRFVELNVKGDGNFFGELIPIRVTDRVTMYVWKNCDVSNGHGVTYDLYVWGLTNGINTVFTRKYWWKSYFIRGMAEKKLGLGPESLRVR